MDASVASIAAPLRTPASLLWIEHQRHASREKQWATCDQFDVPIRTCRGSRRVVGGDDVALVDLLRAVVASSS